MFSSYAIPVFLSSRILGLFPIMPSVNRDWNMFGSYAVPVFSSPAIWGSSQIVPRHRSWLKHVQFLCHPRVFVVQNFRMASNHAKCESWPKHVRFLCHLRVFVVRNFRILPNCAKAWIVDEICSVLMPSPCFRRPEFLGLLPIMPWCE